MKKRVTHKLALSILTVLLLFSMTACGNKENAEADASEAVKEEESISEAAEETEEKAEEAEAPTPEPTEEPEPEAQLISYSLSGTYPFSEDRAWVVYTDTEDNVKYTALIDTEGKVLYRTEKSWYSPLPMQEGAAAINIKTKLENADEYHFIDADGNELGVLGSEDTTTSILGYYKGNFFVREEKSGFSGHSAEYYIADKTGQKTSDNLIAYNIDYEDTNCIYDFNNEGWQDFAIPDWNTVSVNPYVDEAGHCVMAYYDSDEDSVKWTIIDLGKSSIETFNPNKSDFDVIGTAKGIYLGYSDHNRRLIMTVDDYCAYDGYDAYDIMRNNEKNYDPKTVVTGDGRIVEPNETKFLVYDIATGEQIAESPDLGGGIVKVLVDGDNYAVQLLGADHERYVTVLNKELEQLFEPKPMDNNSWDICNGYVVYYKDSTYKGYAPDGSEISYKDDDASGIGVDSKSNFGDKGWFLSDGFFNNAATNGKAGYRSLDGSKVITEVLVKE